MANHSSFLSHMVYLWMRRWSQKANFPPSCGILKAKRRSLDITGREWVSRSSRMAGFNENICDHKEFEKRKRLEDGGHLGRCDSSSTWDELGETYRSKNGRSEAHGKTVLASFSSTRTSHNGIGRIPRKRELSWPPPGWVLTALLIPDRDLFRKPGPFSFSPVKKAENTVYTHRGEEGGSTDSAQKKCGLDSLKHRWPKPSR